MVWGLTVVRPRVFPMCSSPSRTCMASSRWWSWCSGTSPRSSPGPPHRPPTRPFRPPAPLTVSTAIRPLTVTPAVNRQLMFERVKTCLLLHVGAFVTCVSCLLRRVLNVGCVRRTLVVWVVMQIVDGQTLKSISYWTYRKLLPPQHINVTYTHLTCTLNNTFMHTVYRWRCCISFVEKVRPLTVISDCMSDCFVSFSLLHAWSASRLPLWTECQPWVSCVPPSSAPTASTFSPTNLFGHDSLAHKECLSFEWAHLGPHSLRPIYYTIWGASQVGSWTLIMHSTYTGVMCSGCIFKLTCIGYQPGTAQMHMTTYVQECLLDESDDNWKHYEWDLNGK